MLTVHIISLFTDVCEPYFKTSILGRAVKEKKLKVKFYNPIKTNKGSRLDKRPYGGGPGMVLEALPFLKEYSKAKGLKRNVKTIFFTPDGETLTQEKVKELSKFKDIILISGHYEGLDERIVEATNAERISIGDYVLTGGELPAMVLVDAISREIPGVLGNESSLETKRIASGKVYTRPEEFTWKGKKYRVPSVLLSGNHKEIDSFRQKPKRDDRKDV